MVACGLMREVLQRRLARLGAIAAEDVAATAGSVRVQSPAAGPVPLPIRAASR
jgi:hypothetical protein